MAIGGRSNVDGEVRGAEAGVDDGQGQTIVLHIGAIDNGDVEVVDAGGETICQWISEGVVRMESNITAERLRLLRTWRYRW